MVKKITRKIHKRGFDTVELAVVNNNSIKFINRDFSEEKDLGKRNLCDVPFSVDFNGEIIRGYVLEKGQRLFDYVIEDEQRYFRIAVNSKRLLIKIYSKTFEKIEMEKIYNELIDFLRIWSVKENDISASRIDYAIDIEYNQNILKGYFNKNVYCKANIIDVDRRGGIHKFKKFQKAITISSESKVKNIMLRVYDKLFETQKKYDIDVEKSIMTLDKFGYCSLMDSSDYLDEVVANKKQILRYELQVRKELLKTRGIKIFSDLLDDKKIRGLIAFYLEEHTGIVAREFRKVIKLIKENSLDVEPYQGVKKIDIPGRANEKIAEVLRVYIGAFHKNLQKINIRDIKKLTGFIDINTVLKEVKHKLECNNKYSFKLYNDMLKSSEMSQVFDIKGYWNRKKMEFVNESNLFPFRKWEKIEKNKDIKIVNQLKFV